MIWLTSRPSSITRSIWALVSIHRLNVQNILGAVVRPDVEVPVLLNGNADETGHRILPFLAQFFRTLRVGNGLRFLSCRFVLRCSRLCRDSCKRGTKGHHDEDLCPARLHLSLSSLIGLLASPTFWDRCCGFWIGFRCAWSRVRLRIFASFQGF